MYAYLGNEQPHTMKVTYNSKLNAYKINWVDYRYSHEGKTQYMRKQVKSEVKKPTKSEIRTQILIWSDWATKQEEASKIRILEPIAPTTNTDVPIVAVDYLTKIKGDDLCTTKVKKQVEEANRSLKDFITFLNEKYPNLFLHQVNKAIAREYITWLDKKGVSFAYKKKRWMRCGFVFNVITHKFEESEFKYKNPFYAIKIEKVADEEAIQHKKTFSPDTIRLILKEAREYKHSREQKDIHQFQRWSILFLLSVTGIRPKDIMLLKWSQVNLQRRTLTITHYKTAKKGINTVIWLTPHLMDLFTTLKELHEKEKTLSNEYIFSFWDYQGAKEISNEEELKDYLYITNHQSCTNFFKKFREKYNLTEFVYSGGRKLHYYCVYSLRATVGTLLTWQNFNQNSIDYLQGHAPNNTTARFYLNHEANPKKATSDMVNYLAYRIVQQPLGKVGMKYAMQDYEEEQRELRTQKDISSTIHADNTGNSLLGLMVLEKIDEERRRLEEEKQKLIEQYGEEVADILTSDNSPQL